MHASDEPMAEAPTVLAASGGQVLACVAVQHQLIRHQLERIPRQRPLRGEPVLRHRPGQVAVGEHTVRHLVTDTVTIMQWHDAYLSCLRAR